MSTQLLPISRCWLAAGDDVEHADPGDAHALVGDELVAEHLVACRRSASMTTPSSAIARSCGPRASEVGADLALRGVLAAAAEQDVGVVGQRVADADRHHRTGSPRHCSRLRSTSTLPVSP